MRKRPHALVVALLLLVLSPTAASGASLRGPDVSNNNGCGINWHAAHAAQIRFAFAKATESTSFQDRCFGRNWQAMLHEGIVRGAYDFGHPGIVGARAEARFFVHYVNQYGGFAHAFAVLDIEKYGFRSISANRQWVKDWLNETAADGHPAGLVIYSSNLGWWRDHMGYWFPAGALAWPANYGPYVNILAGSHGWDFWQCSDGVYGCRSLSYVPGVGRGDISVFSGDFNRLLTLSGQIQLHAYASRTMHLHDLGSDVRGFQNALNKRLVPRHRHRVHVDGIYGTTTETSKHYVEYALGFPLGVVRRHGASGHQQDLIAHPDQRPKTYLSAAVHRAHHGTLPR